MSVWQLPEGIDELTGEAALALEYSRRTLLDLYVQKGFELVIPSIADYATDLNSKTFKFLDSISNKMLSINADVTPQIARIDAKKNTQSIKKYCYVNTVLKTQADDFYASRSPVQAGVEIYGEYSLENNLQLIGLMLDSLKVLSLKGVVLSLGDVRIFEAILQNESFTSAQHERLRDIFKRRSEPDLQEFIQSEKINNSENLLALMSLEGGECILEEAKEIFKTLPLALEALEELSLLNKALQTKNISPIYDLADINAYDYHTGFVFYAYHQQYSKALAQGGCYHTRALFKDSEQLRTAVGFSFDLKFISQTNKD
jgi:ATP phosphoribosyltransferase regulatory subunit